MVFEVAEGVLAPSQDFPLETPVPLFGNVAPLGLTTPYIESLTGYVQRLANEHHVPPALLFRNTIVPVVRRELQWKRPLSVMLRQHARAIDGSTQPAQLAADCMSRSTGRNDLARCTLLGLTVMNLVQPDGLLSGYKRWCPSCWHDDTAAGRSRYERKLWTLSVVDACAVHSVLLVNRCPTCGCTQPPISRDVRPGVCSLCGELLDGPAIALRDTQGADASRRLWFARQAEVLVHALEVVAVHGLNEKDLAYARQQGFAVLADHVVRNGGSSAVLETVQGWTTRWRRPRLEALFSVLWQARWPVARLFPRRVRVVVDPCT